MDDSRGEEDIHRMSLAKHRYTLRVQGRLDAYWADWLDGLTLHHDGDDSVLETPAIDQAALHGLLVKMGNLNLSLVSVVRLDSEDAPVTTTKDTGSE